MNESPLERRYRRMLRLYPARHRRDHEDEMVGVLLANARPGQSRPDPWDHYDLARGALLIRLRRATGSFSEERWRDAFAIVGIIAPILLIGLSVRALAVNVDADLFSLRLVTHGATTLGWAKFIAEEESLWLGFCAVAILAMVGVRRVGTVAAFALPTIAVGFALSSNEVLSSQVHEADLPVVLSLLTGVALRASPPARRGWQLLGRRVLVIIPFVVAFDIETTEWPTLPWLHDGSFFVMTAAAVATVAGVVSLLRSEAGRRACALLTVPPACLFYSADPIGISPAPVRIAVFLVVVPLAGFTLAAGAIRLLERARLGARR